CLLFFLFFFFQAEDGIRDRNVTGVQTCALPIFKTSSAYFLLCANRATFSLSTFGNAPSSFSIRLISFLWSNTSFGLYLGLPLSVVAFILDMSMSSSSICAIASARLRRYPRSSALKSDGVKSRIASISVISKKRKQSAIISPYVTSLFPPDPSSLPSRPSPRTRSCKNPYPSFQPASLELFRQIRPSPLQDYLMHLLLRHHLATSYV